MAVPAAPTAPSPARLWMDHAGHVDLSACDPGREALHARLDGRQPRRTVSGQEFRLRYPSLPLIGWIVYWHDPAASIALDRSRRWALRFDGGAASVCGDLRAVALDGIDLRGGVKRVELRLPAPDGVVGLRFRGGVGRLLLRRPAGVPLRLRVTGGAGSVELDGQRYGSMGGPVFLTAGPTETSGGGYEVEIRGGAGRVVVSETGAAVPAG